MRRGMELKRIEYIGGFVQEEKFPSNGKPEFAFIGRSNVGKSSLINFLVNRKNLAYVSKEPGKTQLFNFYLVDNQWHLVDLPGYGYAKVSQKTREIWLKNIHRYFQKRKALSNTFVLIDSNIPPQKIDLEFIKFLGDQRVPFALVFTKTDRVKLSVKQENIAAFCSRLKEDWKNLPPIFEASVVRKTGKEEILAFINQVIENQVIKH
jgi:GTP-binding protein